MFNAIGNPIFGIIQLQVDFLNTYFDKILSLICILFKIILLPQFLMF